jgi:hypothetical protein
MKLYVVLLSLISVVSFLRNQSVKVTDMTHENSIMKRLCVISDLDVNVAIFLDAKQYGLG